MDVAVDPDPTSPQIPGPDAAATRRTPRHRVLALVAVVLATGAFVVAISIGLGASGTRSALVAMVIVAAAASLGATFAHDRWLRGLVVLAVVLGVAATALLFGESPGGAAVAAGGALGSALAGRAALGLGRSTLKQSPTEGDPVAPARSPVLFFNPRSGGGKAEDHDLAEACRARRIDAIELKEGDDLSELARKAVEGGADVIGMAGGDGSQALVAAVAAEADLGYVCVPAGTRNHLALDLGLDRNDVLGALDAFGPAVERRIDLGEVNGRVFVNNVSLGAYAEVVQSDDYRDAKVATTVQMLPDLVGRDAEPLDLRFTDVSGEASDTATVIQVSNNAYDFQSFTGMGSRPRLDAGKLGIVTLSFEAGAEAAGFVALTVAGRADEFAGFQEWTADTFRVESGGSIAAGIDGEAERLDPPLVFSIRPRALRVRLPHDAPGLNPAQVAEIRRHHTALDVLRIAFLRTTPPP